jgi:hypothetical protein
MNIKKQYQEAKKEIARPLSNHEIDKWLRKNGIECNIFSYDRLDPDMNLDELFSEDGCCIILYNIGEQNCGHWCTMIRHDKNTVEFFDPYASKLDDNLKYSKNKFPSITSILKNNKVKNVIFNNMRFQRMNNNIATCGRHTSFRILNKHLTLEEYQQGFLNSGYSPKIYDYYIYLLTSDI